MERRLLYEVDKQAQQDAEQTVEPEAPNNAAPARAGASSARRFHALLGETRVRRRHELAALRLAQLQHWLKSQQAERGGPVLPKSPLGRAIQYALNQWEALCVYTTDGRLAIDNNASENVLRRVAVGRKNSSPARTTAGTPPPPCSA